MREKDERFINLDKKVGLFFIVTIAAILAVFLYTMIQQGIFTHRTRVYFIADSGHDINEGAKILLSGFNIGKVTGLTLEDMAKVKVEMSVNSKYMKWIKVDSKARLFKESLMGDMVVEIKPGSPTAAAADEGAILVFEREKAIGEIAEELGKEVKPVLKDLVELIHYINDPRGDVKQTLVNIEKISGRLEETQRRLDSLLANSEKEVHEAAKQTGATLDSTRQAIRNIDGTVCEVGATVRNVDVIVKKLDTALPGIIEKTNKSLDNIQKITADVKTGTEQAVPRVPVIVKGAQEAVQDVRDLAGNAKKIWPMTLFKDELREKTVDVDSYE